MARKRKVHTESMVIGYVRGDRRGFGETFHVYSKAKGKDAIKAVEEDRSRL